MKITFLTPHINISGGVKMILGYADKLAKLGHRVTVVCPQPAFVKRKIKGIPIVYPQRAIMNILKHKPDWIEGAAEIKYVPSYDEKYIPNSDIVVAGNYQSALYVGKYSSKREIKFHLIQHDETLYHGPEKKVLEAYSLPLRKIVVSSWLKEVLKDKFNLDSELIVNPVDLDMFYPARSSYSENKRICMLHHTLDWKGVSDGVEAFEIAKKKHPEVQLVIFGAHKKVVNIKCEYYYKPSKDKLREIYNSCSIFLCPSWKEGFGLPSAEAIACKCVLVTTDTGGCRDYAIHKKTALVSPPKKPEALAENLIKLLDDKDLLKRIAQNGYEHIKQFTWDKAVDKMEKIFLQNLSK